MLNLEKGHLNHAIIKDVSRVSNLTSMNKNKVHITQKNVHITQKKSCDLYNEKDSLLKLIRFNISLF